MDVVHELVNCFSVLTNKQVLNLVYHIKNNTHILCGEAEYILFTDGKGGG